MTAQLSGLPRKIKLAGPFEVLGRRACDKSPRGWYLAGDTPEDYRVEVSDPIGGSDPVALIRAVVPRPRPHAELNHCADFAIIPGQRIRLSAEIKAEGVSDYANLHLRAENEFHEWVGNEKISFRDTFAWKTLSIELTVPEGSVRLQYGFTFESPGRAWIRDVSLMATQPSEDD